VSGSLTTQVGVLARRAMLKTLRQPFQLFPIVFFPLILLAVNASGLKAATRLPGFPTHSTSPSRSRSRSSRAGCSR